MILPKKKKRWFLDLGQCSTYCQGWYFIYDSYSVPIPLLVRWPDDQMPIVALIQIMNVLSKQIFVVVLQGF